jgi:hypothetical protein
MDGPRLTRPPAAKKPDQELIEMSRADDKPPPMLAPGAVYVSYYTVNRFNTPPNSGLVSRSQGRDQ